MKTYFRALPSTTIIYGPRQKLAEACPCRNCDERRQSCHTECEKYKTWRAEYDADKDGAKKAQSMTAILNDYVVEGKRKMRSRADSAAKRRRNRNE